MKELHTKKISFTLYITAVLVLAVLYFTVPERKAFFEFQLQWWSEFRDVILSLIR